MMADHHPEEPGATSPSPQFRQEGQPSEAVSELSAITRLYELSTRLVLSAGLESLLEEILHAVIELHGADFGNVQLYDPVSETLSIVAQSGFRQPFLDCFRSVSAKDSSACGVALSRGERVIIGDTETDPAYHAWRSIAALSGYRAVQSTPLFTRTGQALGMLSTHFRLPHQPSAPVLRLTDLYARQAAELIERHRAEEELRRTNDVLLAEIQARERVEREREQQAQQLRLQSRLLALAHDAILVRDPESRILFWNKGAQNLYGWSEEEARGRVTHSLLQTVFPTSLAQVDAHLEQQGHWEGELVHTCRDGRIVVVESRQALVRDAHKGSTAILEINRDSTLRRQLEQQAHMAQTETVARLSFFQQLIDALPSGIYLVYGQDARLLLANRAAAAVWGATWPLNQPMGEFLASTGIRITNAQGQPMLLSDLATLRAVRQRETIRQWQEIIRRPNQTSLPVLVNAVVLEAPAGWQFLRPGTEAHAATETVALVAHQDVSALKEAEYLKDEFISMAAHELRNPLAALKGFADMLLYQTARGQGSALADWQQEALEEIEQAAARLDKLTEDLLDVTRLQAGRLVLSRTSTDLVALVKQQIRLAQMTTQRHVLTFESALSELVVTIDRRRIEQVLSNLLSNAIKYSPQGGPIAVVLRREGEQRVALLSVADQGIGIPTDQQGKLFGRFVRAENALVTQITGTGLGLYLSRELAEQHGGHLWFASTEGAGSTFFLRLPLP